MKEFSLELSVDRQHLRDAVKGLISTVFFYRAFGSIIPKTNEFLDIPYPYCDIPELDEYIDSKIDLLMIKIDSGDTPLLSTTSTSSTPFGSPPTLKFNNNNPVNTSNNQYLRPIHDDNIDTLNIGHVAYSVPNSPLFPVNTNNSTVEPAAQSINSMTLRSPKLNSHNPPGSRNNNVGPQNSDIKYTQIVINFYESKKLKKPTWFGKIEEEVSFETWLINIRTIKSINTQDQCNTDDEESVSIENLQSHFERLIWDISDIADTNKDHLPIIQNTDPLPFNYSISIKSSGSNDSWKEFIKKMLKDPVI